MLQNEPLPELRNPVVIAAFEGWNDAGSAASGTVMHLREMWDAELVASIEPDTYYDFQVNRPLLAKRRGRTVLQWLTTRITLAHPPGLDHDVLLVFGPEPSVRWQEFIEELTDFMDEVGVTRLITLGGLLADVAHTRPIPVTATTSNAALQRRYGLEESTYQGPTGVTGALTHIAEEEGIPTVSIWAAVPHYAGNGMVPKAMLALLNALEEQLDTVLPRGELEELTRAWERGVDELASTDEEVAEYVQALEEAMDTAELPEASGESLAREFERYLRARDDGEDGLRGRG